MSRKPIVITLVIVLVAAAAAALLFVFKWNGPGKELASDSGIDELAPVTEEIAPLSEDETTLTFYFLSPKPQVTGEILEYVQSKLGGKLNVKLDFQFLLSDPRGYLQKIKTLVSAGQPCDAFAYANYFPTRLKTLADEKVIKDITELFPMYAPNYYSSLQKEEIAAASANGKIYAVPHSYPMTEMKCAIVREDLMNKYTIPEISNEKDFEAYLQKIKEMEPLMAPTAFTGNSMDLFAEANGYAILDYETGLVYPWDDPGMKIEAWEQTPAFKRGIETLQRWYQKEYIQKDISTFQMGENSIALGKWASFISSLGSDYDCNTIAASHGVEWRYKAYPLYPGKISARSSPMGGALLICESSPNAERVLEFVDWLQSDQKNYEALMYGIENKHYTLKDGKAVLPQGVNIAESLYGWGWRNVFMNLRYEHMPASSDTDSYKEYNDLLESQTRYPPHTGFVPDYGAFEELKTRRLLAAGTVEKKIYSGVFVREDIGTFMNEQKSEGIDNLVNGIQKQLDQWKAGQ